jgi:valyl-tRNA synthetase
VSGELKMVSLKTLQNLLATVMISSLFLFSSSTFADTDKSKAKLVETTKVAKGVYVFRWWVYRNVFIVTDEGVIATAPINPNVAKMLMQEIRKAVDR